MHKGNLRRFFHAIFVWLGCWVLIVFIIFLMTFFIPKNKFYVKADNEVCLLPFDEGKFELCSDLAYTVTKENANPFNITVPDSFLTDLASIPRILWPLYAPTDFDTISPSILHDYLYSCPNGYSRKQIDDMFYYALKDSGLSVCAAQRFWIAVRLFGKDSFSEGLECYGRDIVKIIKPEEINETEYSDEEEDEESFGSKDPDTDIASFITQFPKVKKHS